MKKKLLVLAAALAVCSTAAFAAPQTTMEKGQAQIDLGAWNVKSNLSNESTAIYDFDDVITGFSDIDAGSSSKWNFAGGIQYGLTDKLSLEYAYHGLKSKDADYDLNSNGDQNEVNLIYGINKNFGVYAGWNRIKNDFDGAGSATNNVAQLGLIAKAPIAGNTSVYARGAVGTKSTYEWEAGLGIGLGQNADLNVAWRQVKTSIDSDSSSDDWTAKYKGLLVGLSFRFGGGEKVAPAPVVAPQQEVAPAPAPVELKDYYLDSIHFDFDVDTPKASEAPKLANFVNVAKANPNNTFKLVGDTDNKGSDSYNNDLSKRRVLNVAKYATDNGVPASQLKAAYRGEKDPAETNATDAGRAANRRVDIWWTK